MKASALGALLLTLFTSHATALCGREEVIIFGADWCPACKMSEAFLNRHGIAYAFIDVTKRPRASTVMQEHFGTTAIPIIIIDGDYRIGYNQDWLKSSLCLMD